MKKQGPYKRMEIMMPTKKMIAAVRFGIGAIILVLSLTACSATTPGQYNLKNGRSLFEQGNYAKAREHFAFVMANEPDQKELAWQYLLKIRKAESVPLGSEQIEPDRTPVESPQFLCNGEKEELSVALEKEPVSATFIEADLREALLEISTQSGVSIVADETVMGLVTATINNLPLEEALEMILAPNNFSFKRIKSFYLVGDSSLDNPSFHLLSDTCLYKPAHLSPEEIKDLMAPFYKPFLNVHEKRGLLTVVAPQSMQKRIQQDVLNFDREPPQVLLEMTIIEVTSKGREAIGIDWSNEKSRTGEGELLGSSSVVEGGSRGFGLSFTTASSLVTKTFQATIQWLSETGEATLRANPSIVTLDGHEARFSSIHESWVDPTPESFRKEKEKIKYGVNMVIIPRIAENREIVLNIISAEVSDLGVNMLGNPEVISHSISSKVRMREGEALVLGGLLQKKKRHQITKVPFLGDIPILGYFFKNERNEIRETEILIIIKPTVLSSGQVAQMVTPPPLENPAQTE